MIEKWQAIYCACVEFYTRPVQKETLKGYARSLIPSSATEIEKALEILEKACGDTLKVVNHRVDALMKVGSWPQDGGKDCYSKQVKWIIKVQGLLNEIVDLADKNDELSGVIYNREKLTHIMRLFPTFMVDKIVKLPGYDKTKYEAIVSKLDEWKAVSQNREAIYGSVDHQKQAPPAGKQPSGSPSGFPALPKPKRFAACRICKVLEAQGQTDGLYEGHFSEYATGCPKFISMDQDQRLLVAKEAKFCTNCMGKDVKFSYSHLRECPVKKKKNSYSCKKDSCLMHMWLCTQHYVENRQQMERFKEKIQNKMGIQLIFLAN